MKRKLLHTGGFENEDFISSFAGGDGRINSHIR